MVNAVFLLITLYCCLLYQNHPAERIWVEINKLVNYPIKAALNALVELVQLDMEDDTVKFSFSWLTMRLCQVGIERCVHAWNHHPIPRTLAPSSTQFYNTHVIFTWSHFVFLGKGTPTELIQMCHTIKRVMPLNYPSIKSQALTMPLELLREKEEL